MLAAQLDAASYPGRRCPTDRCKVSPHGGYHFWRPDQIEPKSGKPGVMHWAWDLSGSTNETMVYAPENALVIETGTGLSSPWKGFNPGIVLLYGASGLYHVLGHLNYSKILVSKGQPVVLGQPIGVMGISHTHWEIRRNRVPDYASYPTYWQAHGPNNLDPARWLAGEYGVGAKPSYTALKVLGLSALLIGAAVVGSSYLRSRG